MFTEKRILFLYVETPLHVGAGRGSGAVDLPIQRERVTGYPMVQASGLKGCLRMAYREKKDLNDEAPEVQRLFGKAGEGTEIWAGAVAPGDARLLLFPVRSLEGVFAWTTSTHALANFFRAAQLAGNEKAPNWGVPAFPRDSALVGTNTALKAGESVVLEEFSFKPEPNQIVDDIAKWLKENALPDGYDYWKAALPGHLCILPEDAFRDFTQYATEIQTHVRLDPQKKTVKKGALWTTENLPADSLLYAPLMATSIRNGGSHQLDASAVMGELDDLNLSRFQLGGDETTGQGWVATKFLK